jgi:hypothetical protein
LKLAQHLSKLCAVYKFERFALSESQGFIGVNAAGDEYCPVSFFRRHDAEKLPDRLNAHLVGLPPLALDDGSRAVAPEPEVNAPVCTTAADFIYLKPTLPIHLAHLPLEVLPTELVEPADVQMLLEECRPLLPVAPPGKPGSEADEGRNPAQHVAKHQQLWRFDAVLKPEHGDEKEEHRD